MLKVSQLMRLQAYRPRKDRDVDPAKLPVEELAVVGTVRQVVFSPEGTRVVGMLLRRPDVGGMVKREDAFLALDSCTAGDAGLVATAGDASFDKAAIERLGLDWDKCILWTGMDARTTDGKELGWVSDAEFSYKTGNVKAFFVDDGSVAKSLVGSVVIPADMLVGYKDGFMLVKPEVAKLSLNGGLAAKAGTEYARVKSEGKEVASKAATKAARGLGKQIKRSKGMFGAFMDEYKRASR